MPWLLSYPIMPELLAPQNHPWRQLHEMNITIWVASRMLTTWSCSKRLNDYNVWAWVCQPKKAINKLPFCINRSGVYENPLAWIPSPHDSCSPMHCRLMMAEIPTLICQGFACQSMAMLIQTNDWNCSIMLNCLMMRSEGLAMAKIFAVTLQYIHMHI